MTHSAPAGYAHTRLTPVAASGPTRTVAVDAAEIGSATPAGATPLAVAVLVTIPATASAEVTV